jgi:hypothetical protein
MTQLSWTALIALAFTAAAAPAQSSDEADLKPRQREDYKRLKASLQVLPVLPNVADQHYQRIRADLTRFLSATHAPAPQASDALATTLFRGVNNGLVSAPQAALLSKELSKVLDLPEITPRTVYQFTARIEPIVQSTALDSPERMRLYRQALMVLKAAPSYNPNGR